MTDSDFFEPGEGDMPERAYLPFSPSGIAVILELRELFGTHAGEDSLRAALRIFFGARFGNGPGLTGEIGRVIGNGKPIHPLILAEAERHRPVVRVHLRGIFSRYFEKLSNERGADE